MIGLHISSIPSEKRLKEIRTFIFRHTGIKVTRISFTHADRTGVVFADVASPHDAFTMIDMMHCSWWHSRCLSVKIAKGSINEMRARAPRMYQSIQEILSSRPRPPTGVTAFVQEEEDEEETPIDKIIISPPATATHNGFQSAFQAGDAPLPEDAQQIQRRPLSPVGPPPNAVSPSFAATMGISILVTPSPEEDPELERFTRIHEQNCKSLPRLDFPPLQNPFLSRARADMNRSAIVSGSLRSDVQPPPYYPSLPHRLFNFANTWVQIERTQQLTPQTLNDMCLRDLAALFFVPPKQL